MINLEKKIIYIANPKTGSDALRIYLGQPDLGFLSERSFLDDVKFKDICNSHDPVNASWATENDQKEHVRSLLYNEYLKQHHDYDFSDFTVFSTVRNPWDKYLSAYKYSLVNHHGLSPKVVNSNTAEIVDLFGDYVRRSQAVGNGISYEYPDFIHLRSYEYMCLDKDGNDLVDHYFDMSETNKIPEFLHELGVKAPKVIPRTNTIQYPSLLKVKKKNYYTEELRDIVQELHAATISRFNYAFDDLK